MRHLASTPATLAAFGVASAVIVIASPAHAQEAAPLALRDALTRAIESDPGLRAAGAGVDAALGGVRQARVRPNPELGAEVENFNGRDDLRGFNGAETTFSLSQEVELGGQRSARVRLADRELHGAELDRVLRGLDLLRDVQVAYFDALAAQELVAIERERVATAVALDASVARRVAAARDPLMAGARAQAGLAEARIALTRAEAEATTARARLASYWGGEDGFALIRADFTLPVTADHDHALNTDQAPDIARLAAERERLDAAARLERSLSYQNPTLSLGYRRFEDRDGDGALVAGFSIPLGLFNRNQGSVARAQAEQRRAAFDLEAGRRTIAREFSALERALASDAAAVRSTEQDVIPQAERALSLAQDGYNRGAFSYLDVLEAQRALSDARQARVDALRSYHSNEAALDRLTARFAETLPGQEIHQ
ncbi:heavy metal RND efflux outer membrane protein of CzcC family [alpha proteobacterium U9-1i]|nr:heavy metal RND efflux outer membrane protein of CzcC family [alpha proteobacterium U9-1i]